MNEELEVLLIVARRLEKAGIVYMISGSMALNYYATPRMTRDIDVVVELTVKDIDRFVRLFESDFWVDQEMIKSEIIRQGMFNLIHREYIVKIDFIIRKDSPYQIAAFERRKKIVTQGQPVWLISSEDLILAKLLWAKDSRSELQLKDVRQLLNAVSDLDKNYLKKWIKELKLEKLIKDAEHG